MKTTIVAVGVAVLVLVLVLGALVAASPCLAVYAIWSTVARAIRTERLEARVRELERELANRPPRPRAPLIAVVGGCRGQWVVVDGRMN